MSPGSASTGASTSPAMGTGGETPGTEKEKGKKKRKENEGKGYHERSEGEKLRGIHENSHLKFEEALKKLEDKVKKLKGEVERLKKDG